MRYTHTTSRDVSYRFGPACGSYEVIVPKGTKLEPIKDEPGTFWADPRAFDGITRHDAQHYGVRINEADAEPII